MASTVVGCCGGQTTSRRHEHAHEHAHEHNERRCEAHDRHRPRRYGILLGTLGDFLEPKEKIANARKIDFLSSVELLTLGRAGAKGV